jgi:hypothetical protein
MTGNMYSQHTFFTRNAEALRLANNGILVEYHLVFGFESFASAIVLGLLAGFNTMLHD